MTSLEALEAYSGYHSESFEELLEWPYRRFIKAFSSWQKRRAIDEIENRKNIHVGALLGIIEWKEAGDQEKAIENVEQYYEKLKDIVWEPDKHIRENQEMRELEESDPFLRAGKRNIQKVIPVQAALPGQESIEEQI